VLRLGKPWTWPHRAATTADKGGLLALAEACLGVKSLSRPGGNMTGFFLDLPELGGKQIKLLREADPTFSRLAVL
jgi:hypothetical protein